MLYLVSQEQVFVRLDQKGMVYFANKKVFVAIFEGDLGSRLLPSWCFWGQSKNHYKKRMQETEKQTPQYTWSEPYKWENQIIEETFRKRWNTSLSRQETPNSVCERTPTRSESKSARHL